MGAIVEGTSALAHTPRNVIIRRRGHVGPLNRPLSGSKRFTLPLSILSQLRQQFDVPTYCDCIDSQRPLVGEAQQIVRTTGFRPVPDKPCPPKG